MLSRDNRAVMPPRPPLTVVRLADHFGQYIIVLKCECGHSRHARPATLAAIAGWNALLADVVKRLRCSKCGKGAPKGLPRMRLKPVLLSEWKPLSYCPFWVRRGSCRGVEDRKRRVSTKALYF
jgi:hypothetical protein